MSDVRKTPVAITTSDWHIRGTVPASRAESDWYEVMDKRIAQVMKLQDELGGAPVIIAGDVFDNPNPHSEVARWGINALRHMAEVGPIYAIPGNHDLNYHLMDNHTKGAYGLASDFGFTNLIPGKWTTIEHAGYKVALWPMPWGYYEVPEKSVKADAKIAVAHKYMYSSKDKTYVGADEEGAVTGHTAWGKHFDVIAIGDNHISWRAGKFLNHGSLFSMTSAQKQHEHLLGIVYSDGSLETITLPEEKQWKEVYVPPESTSKAEALLAELAATELDAVAFDDLLDRLEGVLSDGARAELRAIRQAD